ncbi:MAG: hypothetical protein NZ822_02315 [Patescibacteria group bacterium]|nr:hypothetical protein [Patescibacteria group bacterium]
MLKEGIPYPHPEKDYGSQPISGPYQQHFTELTLLSKGFRHLRNFSSLIASLKKLEEQKYSAIETLSDDQIPESDPENILEEIKKLIEDNSSLKNRLDEFLSKIEESISLIRNEDNLKKIDTILVTQIEEAISAINSIVIRNIENNQNIHKLSKIFDLIITSDDYARYFDDEYLKSLEIDLITKEDKLRKLKKTRFSLTGRFLSTLRMKSMTTVEEQIKTLEEEIRILRDEILKVRRIRKIKETAEYLKYRIVDVLADSIFILNVRLESLKEIYLNVFRERLKIILDESYLPLGENIDEQNLRSVLNDFIHEKLKMAIKLKGFSDQDQDTIPIRDRDRLKIPFDEDVQELIDLIMFGNYSNIDIYDKFRKATKGNEVLMTELYSWLRYRRLTCKDLFRIYSGIINQPEEFIAYLKIINKCRHLLDESTSLSEHLYLSFYEEEEKLREKEEFFLIEFKFSLFRFFLKRYLDTQNDNRLSKNLERINQALGKLTLDNILLHSKANSDIGHILMTELLDLPNVDSLPFMILNIFRQSSIDFFGNNDYSRFLREKFKNFILEIKEKYGDYLEKLNIPGLLEACSIITENVDETISDPQAITLRLETLKMCKALMEKYKDDYLIRDFIIETIFEIREKEQIELLLEILASTENINEIYKISKFLIRAITYGSMDINFLIKLGTLFNDDSVNEKKIIFKQIFDEYLMKIITHQRENLSFLKIVYDIQDETSFQRFLYLLEALVKFISHYHLDISRVNLGDRIKKFTIEFGEKLFLLYFTDELSRQEFLGGAIAGYLMSGEIYIEKVFLPIIEKIPQLIDDPELFFNLTLRLREEIEKIPLESLDELGVFIVALRKNDPVELANIFSSLKDNNIRILCLKILENLHITTVIKTLIEILISQIITEEEIEYIVFALGKRLNFLSQQEAIDILLETIRTRIIQDDRREIIFKIARDYSRISLLFNPEINDVLTFLKTIFYSEDEDTWQKFMKLMDIFKSYVDSRQANYLDRLTSVSIEKILVLIKKYGEKLLSIDFEDEKSQQEILGLAIHIYLNFGENWLTTRFLPLIEKIPELKQDHDLLSDLITKFWEQLERIPPEKWRNYIHFYIKLQQSPSQEVQRLLDTLIVDILESSDPEKTYERIIAVFESNNLPLLAKIYLIFATLHPSQVLESKIQHHRFLKETESYLKRRYILYRDLLRVHIDSANPSLREYLEVLISGQDILSKAEEVGFENLADEERIKLKYFFIRLEALYINSYLGRSHGASVEIKDLDLTESYERLKKNLRVKEGESVIGRIERMFLKPLGYESIQDVLNRMKTSIETAHQRNLELYQRSTDGHIYVTPGTIFKGTSSDYLEAHLENGLVAKEFLGAYFPGSDATPLDTDAARVMDLNEKGKITVFQALQRYAVKEYGDIIIAIKDRGQWQDTSKSTEGYSLDKYELFITGRTSERHIGIRTGIASTEIDFIIVTDNLLNDFKKLENIFYLVARSGFYIPIVDESGKIIFTPEMYEEYRKTFEGLTRYYAPPMEVKDLEDTEITIGREKIKVSGERIKKLIDKELDEAKNDRDVLREINSAIENEIDDALRDFGSYLRHPESTEFKGADLLNTGSTGRMTNLPGDYDFDFILRVDPELGSRLGEVAGKIIERFSFEKDNSHSPKNNFYQVQLKGVKGIKTSEGKIKSWKEIFGTEEAPESLDIDIGITPKSTLIIFGSHDAVIEKLNSISSEDKRNLVIGNILLAKRILKQYNAYERVSHGGFGGIGTENWILLNGGNFIEACRTFLESAIDEEGNIRSFDEFKKRYKILNPGTNLRHMNHDNYIENMRAEGYQSMVRGLINFLRENSM